MPIKQIEKVHTPNQYASIGLLMGSATIRPILILVSIASDRIIAIKELLDEKRSYDRFFHSDRTKMK